MQKRLNVVIIGAGLMGHGIAQVFAAAGDHVTLTDANADVLSKAPDHIAHNLGQMGIVATPILNNVHLESNLFDAVALADLIIEAVRVVDT